MSTAAERKFINLRKRLDQLGYRQPLGVESLPLVEKLFSDLVHTTESLRSTKLSAGKIEKECSNFDAILEPYKAENAKLTRENNELHLEILKLKEQSDRHVKDLKATLRKVEHETADLKFLNNQYIHKIRSLERDNKAKTEKIQQLQEKNLQAVVQTPGGRKRNIPFRRQLMQIDQPVPPSGVSTYPIPQPDDPYVADLLQVADNRIHELQLEVAELQEKLEISERGVKNYSKQVELRDREIERLVLALDGGRSHDVISLESRSKSNEKLIAHLNLQVEYLQQTNRDLENRIQDLLDTKQNVTSEVVHLSNKNEELCQELSEIDHLAQQLERHKEIVLETADKEIGEAKKEIKRKHSEIQDLEETITRFKSELCLCRREKERLADELFGKADEKQNFELLLNQLEQEKQRLSEKVENFEIIERELVLEVERMRLEYGIAFGDKSPSRLDAFVKTLEEDRDYYKRELEYLQKMIKRRASPCHRSPEKSENVRLITRERDELQSMLDRFEKHMIEIQSNVKLLTAERDKLNVLYEQSQDELNKLRREAKHTLVSQSHVEEERDAALADFRRIMAEKESLREKLKVQQEATAFEKSKMERNIAELENTICGFETQQFELKSTISVLKERINSLEDELKTKSYKLAQTSDNSSQFKAELCSLQLLNEQLQRSLEDLQHQSSLKKDELQSAQEEIAKLEEKIDRLNHKNSSQDETVNVLRSTISVLDKEKDSLQETVDEKTERIACLDDNLANKEKTIANFRLTLSELESSINQLKEALSNRDREIASLRRQLDASQVELAETGRVKEMALKENRRLQNDLAIMTRENQTVTTELEEAIHEKEEMKTRVHNYITEVSRFESLMASKDQENQELLEKFRTLHSQAEDWEVKAHQAEGESSSIRLELLSVDTDRRHLRETVELLEKEIQEHINAHQAYESQLSSITKNMSRLEEDLKYEQEEKSSVLADLASVRELCMKLESSKEHFSRQLTSKNLDYERVLAELEDIKSEAELLKKQLSSERLTIQNLETLLATSRDKEFQNHLKSHEKDSEIQLLKDKLTLAESKLTSHNREVSMLRSKVAQLQTDYDVLKRQLTTERFERERAIQEMRRHGLSTSSVRTSSPLSSTMRSPSHSPERTIVRTTDRAAAEKSEQNLESFIQLSSSF
ncbi:centrosomal protein of 135 kDa isoform X1 [Dermochelys coriacea]|uniref:centrosomal protein of 135 kDa isoform X1 n=1 Tax=Dermochelys coriacea TaxID=27794 RepID=UPI0018E786FC|nr:centrosomal protein of 135 kDa isoform X1 [Dermochelys coriacea]XP_038256607.1 centrosomal protein of 135 kDa isoform X1 [Dermochelys coriacea]XP_043369712.1 centrosomal protein of 135 kDa isoform X1 [Dermochelys coriacea]XP_043369713.1 centrosomal protein of 135 kDa isoform X1 [Dermochelys coriacea]